MHDVLVVGAGLAGLSCAFTLKEAGADVCILDANPEAGGVVGTDRVTAANGDSFLFERGPNTVQASSRRFRELCGRVGIADRLIASNDEAKRRYLFLDGELRELPKGPLSFLNSNVLSGAAKRKIASEPLRRFKKPAAGSLEPTLLEFFEERIGAEATRKLAGAFVRGIYAAELSELGIRSAFPRLYELCLEHGGLLRGMIGMRRASKKSPLPPAPGPEVRRTTLLSFPEGLGELPRAMSASLGEALHSGVQIESLHRAEGGWRVEGSDSQVHQARQLVLAVPAPAAAALLEKHAPESASTLRSISHGRLTLIHQGFSAGKGASSLPPGFGFLVPPAESGGEDVNLSVLGTIFGSNCFAGRAPAGGVTTTQFYRTKDLPQTTAPLESADSSAERAPNSDQQRLLETAHRELTTVLGASLPQPTAWRIQPWDDVIPRYAPGHSQRVAEVRESLVRDVPGLSIIGNYTDGVSVENVVGSGLDEAARLLKSEARA